MNGSKHLVPRPCKKSGSGLGTRLADRSEHESSATICAVLIIMADSYIADLRIVDTRERKTVRGQSYC